MNKIQTCFLFVLIAGLSTLTSTEQGKPESAVVDVQSNFEFGRINTPTSKKMAVIGGNGENGVQVKCYNFTKQSWDIACLPEMSVGRFKHGVVQIDTKLYAVGGYDSKFEITKSMSILDLENRRQWSKGRDMNTTRAGHGTAMLNGLIYAVGGYDKLANTDDNDDMNELDTGEVFNPTTDSWSEIKPMSTKRYHFSLVPVGNKLYAIGGVKCDLPDYFKEPLNTVECYDPAKETWSTITSGTEMTAREGAAVAVLDGKIYVAGGRNKYLKVLNTFEMFDPLTKEWQPFRNMTNPRAFATMVAFGSNLYIFGGLNIETSEIYDPGNDSWTPFPTNFEETIDFAASLVITAAF